MTTTEDGSVVLVRLENARWALRIRLPAAWVRSRRVDDLLHVVAKSLRTQARDLARETLGECPPAAALALVAQDQHEVARDAVLRAVGGELRLRHREAWRARPNAFVERVPGDALRQALQFAGGDPEGYRAVCARFRDEASAIVRRVRCGEGHDLGALSRAFPRSTVVVAAGQRLKTVLDAAAYWTRLVALDLAGAGFGDAEFATIVRRLADTPIRALDVSRCERFGTAALAAVRTVSTLEAIDVSHTNVLDLADLGITYLAARGCATVDFNPDAVLLAFDAGIDLSTLKGDRLRWLSLNCKALDDQALRPLRDLPLHGLDLAACSLSDVGIALLFSGTSKLRDLADLSLRACDLVTDASLHLLAQHAPRLVHLDLELLWRLSADGICVLAFACRRLRHIYLRGAGSVARRQLRDRVLASLPNLAIHFTPRDDAGLAAWPARPLHDLFFRPTR